jgi:hypothetical protein
MVLMHASLISKWQMLVVLGQTVLSLTSIDWVDCVCVYLSIPLPLWNIMFCLCLPIMHGAISPTANTANQLTYVSECDTTWTPPSGEIRYLGHNTTLLRVHYHISDRDLLFIQTLTLCVCVCFVLQARPLCLKIGNGLNGN